MQLSRTGIFDPYSPKLSYPVNLLLKLSLHLVKHLRQRFMRVVQAWLHCRLDESVLLVQSNLSLVSIRYVVLIRGMMILNLPIDTPRQTRHLYTARPQLQTHPERSRP